MRKLFITWCVVCCSAVACAADFCIAQHGQTAGIVVDNKDWTGVIKAAQNLSDDVRKVTGTAAPLSFGTKPAEGSILIGTIGKSRLIDGLVKRKRIDVSEVKGQWESYLIDVVDGTLVIAGSDRRGTIYGIYDLSQRIGVSPWYWWADAPVNHRDELVYDAGRFVQPSPKVKYRGIFINDEDWGLKPWASNNYEKELGDIGPRTYARVCELLLRLRANMLAPAMHSCTGAFYSHSESKAVCDSFGIIITTSHCEPLLLNNAAQSEWDQDRDGDWNYKTNSQTILRKWDNRLKEASQYENIYTMAMRGVHDAGLRGNLPMQERVPLIEQVISDQRQLLASHLSPLTPEQIPQIFVPYKETMDIYENGLRVPDDVTLVWVDDNYGYMKRVSSPQEQQRSGRSGVYYHLSYLGAPHDYLWLNTTPPVLMYEELLKAYHAGADRYWLLNVGDIKPGELGIQTFMDMAWNPEAFCFDSVRRHQARMLARLFGQHHEATFQAMLDEYYRLAWIRKPEFMGFEYEWDDREHTGLKPTDFSFQNGEAWQRLSDYQRLSDLSGQLSNGSAAWFELVQFPMQAAYQMNRKFLMAQLNGEMSSAGKKAEANWAARQMELAYDSINALNHRYNELLGGKWRGMMALPPGVCALYQNKPEVTRWDGIGEKAVCPTPLVKTQSVVDLSQYNTKSADVSIIRGLGCDNMAIQLGQPHAEGEPFIEYTLPPVTGSECEVCLATVPFWPIYQGHTTTVAISVDDAEPQVFNNVFKEYSRTWKDQVMCNAAHCTLRFAINPEKTTHVLRISTREPGQMIQRISVVPIVSE